MNSMELVSKFSANNTKPITVPTQFLTNDGLDDGTISRGEPVLHPERQDCPGTKAGTNFLEKGGMGAVNTIFQKVIVMSLWDDHDANMLWLDSTYPPDATPDMKGAFRGHCDITSSVPADVEGNVPDSKLNFADIKCGKTGTTIETSTVIRLSLM